MHDFEVKLIGHQSDAGQILAQDMVNLATSTQALITRLARSAVNRRGPGRSESALEHLSRVRVTGLSSGSTVISFSFGDPEALDFDDPVSEDIDDAFWQIASGLESNSRPEHVTDSVAAAVDGLIGAFRHAAPTVEVTLPERGQVRLNSHSLDREIWQSGLEMADANVSYAGILEMLDLRNGVFRIADDVSNRVLLREVRSPHETARLVDSRVRASGRPVYAADGTLRHLIDVTIEGVTLPENWEAESPDLTKVLGRAQSPSVDGGVELTDDEFRDFMAAIHG